MNIFVCPVFSSTDQRPASYCHGVVSAVRACVRKLFLQKTSPQKLLTEFLPNFTGMFLRWPLFLHGSVVKCLTRNPGVLGSSRTGFHGFFRGSVLGQDTSEPSLLLVKPRKDINNVSCCHDMTEILLKAV